MEPHLFEHEGDRFEVRFERTPEGWIGRIRREDDAAVHVVAFPDGPGFDADDVRGSLIAGCEAAVATLTFVAPTRH